MYPTVACLCPTYGRPTLLANAVACFMAQDYPANKRHLFILDDAGQLRPTRGPFYTVDVCNHRYPHLAAKYEALLRLVCGFPWCRVMEQPPEQPPTPIGHHPHTWHPSWECHPDVILVWDDDDVYMPWHIKSYVSALNEIPGWVHPERVWSDAGGTLRQEGAAGRFHGSLGISWELLTTVGGWVQTKRADFDQQMIARLQASQPPRRPDTHLPPSYIFRWGSTKAFHCQALMSSPDDETWYDRYQITEEAHDVLLSPAMDRVCSSYYSWFGGGSPSSAESPSGQVLPTAR